MRSMDTLDALIRAGTRRIRVLRAVDAGVCAGAAAAVVISVASLLHWLAPARIPALSAALAFALCVCLVVAAASFAASRGVSHLQLLSRFDRTHSLSDLLASAWELARSPRGGESALVQATLARAERAARDVDVRASLPWRRPRGLRWLALSIAIATLTIAGLQPPRGAAEPITRVEPEASLERLLTPAQIDAFRARLDRIDRQAGGATTDAIRAELERTLDEIAVPADRLRVLRRLGELEQRAVAIARGARATTSRSSPARESASSSASESSADDTDDPSAERSGPPAAAAPAERSAPPQIANDDKEPAKPQGLAPPSTLEKAGPEPREQQAKRDDVRTEPETSDTPPTEPPSGESSSPPGSKEARPVAASRSKGDPNDGSPRGPDLERHRVPDNAAERQRGENLADAISELRDMMRRDQTLHADLGDSGGDTPPRDRTDPKRDSSRGNRPGAPNAAYASGGPPQVGREVGDSPREDVPQLPAAGVRIAGVRSAGPVRSQVIYGAAQRGFASSDYARVHAEYEDHAERELERESIPSGYRGYVRRYFEAIAPRKAP